MYPDNILTIPILAWTPQFLDVTPTDFNSAHVFLFSTRSLSDSTVKNQIKSISVQQTFVQTCAVTERGSLVCGKVNLYLKGL